MTIPHLPARICSEALVKLEVSISVVIRSLLFLDKPVDAGLALKAGKLSFFTGLLDFDLHASKGKIACFVKVCAKQIRWIDSTVFSILAIGGVPLTKRNGDRIWTNARVLVNRHFHFPGF